MVGYADQMTSDVQRMQTILIVVICVAALVLGVSVGSTISRQRGSQIAVFKAFGRSGEWILGCLEMEALFYWCGDGAGNCHRRAGAVWCSDGVDGCWGELGAGGDVPGAVG
ncbi:ABC transporter associated permease [Cutibacterium acnes JCM 18916]|nr:ABC transporter associated permease [Cutibacterium acnes JCM 18916]